MVRILILAVKVFPAKFQIVTDRKTVDLNRTCKLSLSPLSLRYIYVIDGSADQLKVFA
jgi:hypothetical protein